MPPFEAKTSALWECLQCTVCSHRRQGSEQHTRQDCPALAVPIHPLPSWCGRAPQIEESCPYSDRHAGRKRACAKRALDYVVDVAKHEQNKSYLTNCFKGVLLITFEACTFLFKATFLATIFEHRFSTIRPFFLPHVYALCLATPKHKVEKKESNTGERTHEKGFQKLAPVSQN